MARPINQLCLACAKLSQQSAIARHGPHTETACWDPQTCPRRRSHYRNRRANNDKQRGYYRAQKTANQAVEIVESIFVPVQVPPVALIYLYKEKPKDAHLHALSVSVWQGSEKLAEVEPIHCMGMTNTQVNHYLKEVLKVLGDRFGITEFEPPIRMEPTECEIAECPLKDKARDSLCTSSLN
ncbi:MAG: hypothetical protein HC768_23455 [Acaryochloris sp. CRU_2_0]|nr:hypothetical protein [Acaryochloris sp. CRU_2_0]